jgi:carbamoylphosphate synthase large subunit
MPMREEMKMSKATTWTVIWIDATSKKTIDPSKPVLDYETFTDLKSLEARVISLSSQSIQYTVVTGDILEVSIDTSPRVTIGATPTPAKKERARRRTKAEMAADALAKAEAKKAKANGTAAVAL